MPSLVRYAVAIAAISVACGCASRSAAYRLMPTDEGSVLLPPNVKHAGVTARKVKLKGLTAGACPQAAEGIALRRRKRSLRLAVTQSALHMRPNGWLLGWAADLEGSGCLPPGKGLAAARLVAQALPSGQGREYALLNSTTRTTGRADLLPWTKLRVTTPIFREGSPAGTQIATDDPGRVERAPGGLAITLNASGDFAGYELTWYALRPRPEGGAQMELEFSETHIGEEATRNQTSRRALEFGDDARYFRMLVLTRISASDQDTAFVSGTTLAELEARTRVVEANPSGCKQTPGCVAIDTGVALLPFVVVHVNGEEVLAQPGSTVREALREAGETNPEAITSSLTVERDCAGRLPPVGAEGDSSDLLGLNLLGSEALSWKTESGQ